MHLYDHSRGLGSMHLRRQIGFVRLCFILTLIVTACSQPPEPATPTPHDSTAQPGGSKVRRDVSGEQDLLVLAILFTVGLVILIPLLAKQSMSP